MQVHVLIEQDETGVYCASVPSMPGCYSDGQSEAEARVNILESMELWLEAMDAMAVRALPEEERPKLTVLTSPVLAAKAA